MARLRHLRHRDLDGLDRGRLDRTKADLSAFGSGENHTFTAAVNDELTIGASLTTEKPTNTRVMFTTTDTLPDPLQSGVIYNLISVTPASRIYSVRTGLTGSVIDIADTGTGTHTIHFPYEEGYPK